jgi:hypothetical protein
MDNTPPIPHHHTSTCWLETHLPECYEHRIIELETQLLVLQAGLRSTGGALDRMENIVRMLLKKDDPKEV